METISPQVEEKPLELYMFTTGKLPEYYEKARMDKIALENSEKPKCAITGQEAKYLDPVTRKYYSTVEAFKMLRVQYNDEKSDITEPKIYNLNDETPNYVKCED